MSCECGCGWEGEDEVTQFLIEEAAWLSVEIEEINASRQVREREAAEEEAEATYTRLRAKAEEALRRS